jgi:hypothetical protein
MTPKTLNVVLFSKPTTGRAIFQILDLIDSIDNQPFILEIYKKEELDTLEVVESLKQESLVDCLVIAAGYSPSENLKLALDIRNKAELTFSGRFLAIVSDKKSQNTLNESMFLGEKYKNTNGHSSMFFNSQTALADLLKEIEITANAPESRMTYFDFLHLKEDFVVFKMIGAFNVLEKKIKINCEYQDIKQELDCFIERLNECSQIDQSAWDFIVGGDHALGGKVLKYIKNIIQTVSHFEGIDKITELTFDIKENVISKIKVI